MKIRLLSDLHLEHCRFDPAIGDEDLIILAGDIAVGNKGIKWAREVWRTQKILYVPGNHEFYGNRLGVLPKAMVELENQAADLDITCFATPGKSIKIDGVTFVGGTLWTDMEYWPEPEVARLEVSTYINDYRYIIQSDSSRLTIDRTVALHKEFLNQMPIEGKETVVVVTHHAPSKMSCLPKYLHDPTTAAFVSHLDQWIMQRPNVTHWFHGHCHNSSNYKVGACRVIANPRGYASESRCENQQFNPNLIVEIFQNNP